MDFHILGPIEAVDGDRQVALGGSKQRALLGMLLLHANEVVASDRLIDELWPGEGRDEAIRSLHVTMSRLRTVLEPGRGASRAVSQVLVTRSPGYELLVEPEGLDASHFEALAREGKHALAAGDAVTARAKLDEALCLWRGAPLADLAYESFCQAEIARLDELRIAALEDQIEADLCLGRHVELVSQLRALVSREPLRERLRASLMLALYRSGRQAQALEAYADARRTLVDGLGIEPGRELRRLHEAILRQDPELQPAARVGQAAGPQDDTFVGREQELEELIRGLDNAIAGHGRLFLVAGEPGIGKSRLAQELIAHARARGFRVLVGRCWEAGGAPAYWPWEQALRAYDRDADPAGLGQHFPRLGEAPAGDSETTRFRLFDATVELLRKASEGRPVLLHLDDVHAADPSSLLLLRFVARELASTRIILLACYRDVDPVPGPPLTDALAEVAREPVTRRLRLVGLSEREVAEYVDVTAPEIASSELRVALWEKTEGNPFFIGEVVRLLANEGFPTEPTDTPRLRLPQSIREVVGRRMNQFSDECKRLLALASVLGREFPLHAVARAGGVSQDRLLETLDEAIAARVIADAPGSRLRFAHVLVRDTIYEGLTTARRVRLHREAVEALEALYRDDPGPHLAELAHHAIAAGDLEKGIRYASCAGDRALAMLAYEEAARLYASALEALDLGDPRDERMRCELLLSRGQAETRAGNSPAAQTAFLEAARVARQLGLPREVARAAVGYGGRIVWGRAADDDRLVPILQEGLATLGDEDVELRARLLARLAGALRDEPRRDSRDTLSREAVALARRTGNPAALAYALDGRAASIIAPDTVDECLALGSELCEVAQRAEDAERVLAGHSHRLIAQLQVGDLYAAEADLDAASRIADQLKQPAQLWQVSGWRAMLALAAGRLSEAEELIPQALLLGHRAQRSGAIPVYWLQRYTLCELRGRLEEVEPAINDLAAEYPTRPVMRCVRAHLHARLGRRDDARRALEDLAEDDFSTVPFDQEWLYGMSLLAETAALLGERDAAAALYRLMLPHARLNVVDVAEGIRGSVARYLGLLAMTTRCWEDAEQHFEDAVAMNSRMGARPWLAHTQSDYARMLFTRGVSGEDRKAELLLSRARATYEKLGAS
jgi:DNA-binding SARP family transcriptional activator